MTATMDDRKERMQAAQARIEARQASQQSRPKCESCGRKVRGDNHQTGLHCKAPKALTNSKPKRY